MDSVLTKEQRPLLRRNTTYAKMGMLKQHYYCTLMQVTCFDLIYSNHFLVLMVLSVISLSLRMIRCVKSAQIRSFFWSVFSVFSPNTGKYGAEKTAYLDTFHAVIVSSKKMSKYRVFSDTNTGKYGPGKFRIRTLSTAV